MGDGTYRRGGNQAQYAQMIYKNQSVMNGTDVVNVDEWTKM